MRPSAFHDVQNAYIREGTVTMFNLHRGTAGLAVLLVLTTAAWAQESPRTIDGTLIGNETAGEDWASYGRTYSENHSSPLKEISAATIGRLGLAWSHDLESGSGPIPNRWRPTGSSMSRWDSAL